MLPIRRLLLRDHLILMTGLFTLLLGLAWWGQQRALERQAGARAKTALRHLDELLRIDLQASQSLGQVVHDWWADGTLDPAQPEQAARMILPVLTAQHSITSLNLATTDGRSLLFLRIGNVWSLRELESAGPGARIRWRRLDSTGPGAPPGPWTPMPYDPRTRPWYAAGAAASAPAWTEPYTFYTTQDPGITYTLPFRDGAGLRGVVALDFLLDDLTRRVWSAQPTPGSQSLVVDPQGRALILPRDAAYESPENRRQAFLKAPEARFPNPGIRLEDDANDGAPRRISLGGRTAMGLSRSFEGLPGLHWSLLLAIPEDDLLGPLGFRVAGLLGLVIIGLALAAWRIHHIARRVAEPITALGAMAETLGQGGPAPTVRSDIQEIRSLERALVRADESLADRARLQSQLEHSQRMETVGTLAGGIAHDVNNQLAAILGQLHLSRELLPEGHPVINRILRAEEATKRCAQTTKALLSFSHQSRPELKPLDLNALIRDTAALMERLLGGMIRLHLALDPDLPRVEGDSVQLEQVLMNLVVNARDAMPTGGGLSLRTFLGEEGQVCMEVQDTGTGIPEHLLPHIFEPFVTTKDATKGTGLGLAMVFGIVRAHQGQIWAENAPGGGACFRMCLPPIRTGAPQEPPVPTDPAGAPGTLAGRRILVAEDEALLRDMLADALTLARAQVTAAPDGGVAWQAWQTGRFDLILSDHRMPDCTGLELLERIRATGSTVPFILVSGQGLEGMEAKLAQVPRVRLLPKPFELSRLLGLMAEMLAG
ncbi:ATP-binding protein [Geothrix terrae]|uniref:ATP-binding protein n=1 Tax=Geothrix terrae TaxID=2922720 RepID=UPI001FAB6187|nr:ATP-binding protein [Geothrix terrae]